MICNAYAYASIVERPDKLKRGILYHHITDCRIIKINDELSKWNLSNEQVHTPFFNEMITEIKYKLRQRV